MTYDPVDADADGTVEADIDSQTANIQELSIDGTQVTRSNDVTLYVDESNGDDNNDGTSKSEAFASYERAFEEVARFTESHVEIRQIGDYNSEVVVQGRFAANQVDTRGATIKIIGDSELGGQSASPSEMESINADLKILASSGVVVEWLHTNGRVWVLGSAPFYIRGCKFGSGGTAFFYNKSSHGTIYNCDFDPQSQDPIIGVFCAVGGVTEIGGGTTFTNWDPNANDFFKTDGGIVLDDDWEGSGGYKESDVSRSGISMPHGGFTLGYPTVDRGLRGKPIHELREVSNASAGDLSSGEWAFDDNRGGRGNGSWVFKASDGTLYYKDFDNSGELLLSDERPISGISGALSVDQNSNLVATDTNTQAFSKEKSGSVTLSSGSAIVSTSFSEPVEVTLDPTNGGAVSQQVEVSATARNDGSGTIEVKIYETGTDVGNPTIGYDILTVN